MQYQSCSAETAQLVQVYFTDSNKVIFLQQITCGVLCQGSSGP